MNLTNIIIALAAVAGVPLALIGYTFFSEAGLRRLTHRTQTKLRPWLWLLPGFLLLIAFLIYPVINTIVLSFMNRDGTGWQGLDNYFSIFTEGAILVVLRNNLLWLVFFTAIAVVLGLLLAVLTDRVRYEAVAKALIFLPMAISFVAAGVIWKFMYEYKPVDVPQIGAVNALLLTLIPHFQPQAWLFNQTYNTWALIIVGIWMWTGFCVVIISAGLKGIATELLEAARVDGASERQIFFKIMLPLLKPTLIVVATTMFINVLKIFDIVYVMTNGNLGTEVIANRMYKEMFIYRNSGQASALAVILLLAIIPVMVINIRRFGRKQDNE